MNCSIEDARPMQLDILKKCVEICDRHGLTYFLAQGTLLGAVRNGGFIPWDDDIDIIMPAEDLEKFSKYFADEASEDLFLENYKTEENCPYPWTKIRKNNTTSMPEKYKDMPVHWGICIDIFPYYSISGSKLGKLKAKLCFKIAKKMLGTFFTPYEDDANLISRIIAAIPGILRRKTADAAIRLLKGKNTGSKYVFALCKNGKVLKRSWLTGGREIKMRFEGEQFRVPFDCDAYLTEMYGNYMEVPPANEQKGHDLKLGKIIWDCEKDYLLYR